MGEEKVGRILRIVSKYINKYRDCEIINYYDLFGIDSTKSCQEVSSKIKKLKVLLHPDLQPYLPDFMRDFYSEVLEEFGNCERIFSSKIVRDNYDKKLSSINKNTTAEKTEFPKENNQNTEKTTQPDDISEEELNYVIDAIELTLKSHGLEFITNNVWRILAGEYTKEWTHHFSRDSRANLRKIGLERFKEIIKRFSKEKDDAEEITIDCFTALYQSEEKIALLFSPFENACKATLNKYNSNHMKAAVAAYVDRGYSNHFTNDNNSRIHMVSKFNQEDVIEYINIYLNSFKEENKNYAYSNLRNVSEMELVEMFSNKFIEEETKKKQSRV